MNKILSLARPDILQLQPYQHGAWDPSVERMHTNEMPWPPASDTSALGLNHYPQPQPAQLISRLAELYGVDPAQMIIGRGSDEAIDLIVRAFCRAGMDKVIVCPPTYGMYKVAARIQGADIVEVPMLKAGSYQLDSQRVTAACDATVKIVFLCSPNNPTGNLLSEDAVLALCRALDERCLIVVDEAYIEFSEARSCARFLSRNSNLVVLRTLSKAHALAGARCGALLAHPDIIRLLSGIIAPYAVPSPTVDAVMLVLGNEHDLPQKIQTVLSERAVLAQTLMQQAIVKRIWPSDANFLLVECHDAAAVLDAARSVGLIIRDQRSQFGLSNCVRISVGTPDQNRRLLAAIASVQGAAA